MKHYTLPTQTSAGFPGFAFCEPPKSSLTARVDRSHVVVDLENLCGGSEAVDKRASAVRQALSPVIEGPNTQIVVAVGINAWRKAPMLSFLWPNARFLVGRGVDGADLRLVEDLIDEPQAVRSSRVVIASGDGRFAEPARALRDSGVHVVAVSYPKSLSRRLRASVNEVQFLLPPV
jgi:hypothetical protein